jgi:hypothetical protein
MRHVLALLLLVTTLLLLGAVAEAQLPCSDQGTWTAQTFKPLSSSNDAIENPLLLTDGRVMAQYVGHAGNQFQDWWALSPDQYGCYSTGNATCQATWHQLPSLTTIWGGSCMQGQNQNAYGPGGGFASAVLADGNVIVEGGEANCGQELALTNKGAIYYTYQSQPTWAQVSPPQFNGNEWPWIGDSASIVLADGTFMLAACGVAAFEQGCQTYGSQQALFCEGPPQCQGEPLSWTITGTGKNDNNMEENWVLLPSSGSLGGSLVLDLDVYYSYCNNPPACTQELNYNYSETYNPQTGDWTAAGTTAGLQPSGQLWGREPAEPDIGPLILLPPEPSTPNGLVFATGSAAAQSMTPSAYSAFYNPSLPVNSRWSAGPTLGTVPIGNGMLTLGMGDSPAVVLPDGNALMAMSAWNTGSYFYEWDQQSQSLCPINAPDLGVPSSSVNMLLLPTGQVFVTLNTTQTYGSGGGNPTNQYYIYTPGSKSFSTAWQPSIMSVSGNLTEGMSYPISGFGFNGVTQAVFYGDDYEGATNYPLVQIYDSAGHKFFAPTYGHSTMGVGTGSQPVSTNFIVPTNIPAGNYNLVVIANGIPSNPMPVTVNTN